MMNAVASPRIGIWGGMGPDAGNNFTQRFLQANKEIRAQQGIVWNDQVAPNYVLMSAPVPDRTAAIKEQAQTGAIAPQNDPYPWLQRFAQDSLAIGVSHVLLVCNTAHNWLEPLRQQFPALKFVSLIETTVQKLKQMQAKTVALMATDGTVQTGLYQKELAKAGITCLASDPTLQQMTMEGIYQGVKANNYPLAKQRLEAVANAYLQQGADYLILGCTEIPEAKLSPEIMARSVDPNQLGAERLARIATGLEA